MQDIHAIGGGVGGGGGAAARLFGGGGDRRLRPHGHQHQHHQNHQHQALKCPRCDSVNTKFCYYNNYNLSQPRHFCKNCRRYWTKGGVLRNVPVGGGCRKTKRSSSKPKQDTATTTIPAAPSATSPPPQPTRELKSSNSHSSSESSSLTAAAANTAVEASSAGNNIFGESKIFESPNFESGLIEQGPGSECGIFGEIGSFTSLIASSSNENMSFGFSNNNMLSQQQQQVWQQQELAGALMDHQTVQSNRSGNDGIFGSLDWQGSGDHHHQGFFDITNAVDQAYWSQTHWATDQDHPSLYLP